jgi:hypothetical protein
MLIFYLDELGDGSMKRSRVGSQWKLDPRIAQWFILTAVGVRETARKDLAEQIMAIKDRYFPSWRDKPWGDTEIKGRYLHRSVNARTKGKAPYDPGYKHLTAARLTNLCADLGRLFLKFRPIVYAVAIDKATNARKRAPRDPVCVAYAFLQQRLALLVDDIYGDAEGALMLADEQQSHEKLFRTGEVHATRGQITGRLPRQPNFDLVLDRPIWIDSKLHPLDRELLQLPDIVCYAIAELIETGAAPSGKAHMWPQIKTAFAYHFTTGEIPDAGISIYPRPSPYPSI